MAYDQLSEDQVSKYRQADHWVISAPAKATAWFVSFGDGRVANTNTVNVWYPESRELPAKLGQLADALGFADKLEYIEGDGFDRHDLWQWAQLARETGKTLHVGRWYDGALSISVIFYPDGEFQYTPTVRSKGEPRDDRGYTPRRPVQPGERLGA